MPIIQKRIFEVTVSERLQRLLAIENHTVTTLRELRDAYFAEGNEISNVLGSFAPASQSPIAPEEKPKQTQTAPIAPRYGVGKTAGTAEQKNKIFALLKEKPMTSRDIIAATGMKAQDVYLIMHSLYEAKLIDRRQKTDTKALSYVFTLPPSDITIVA